MNDHILHSYDREIETLHILLSQMGGLAEKQLADTMTSLRALDLPEARRILQEDIKLDALERDLEQKTIILIARRAPVADDLRNILSTLKMAGQIERMGDYAKNIAKRTAALALMQAKTPGHPSPPPMLHRMGEEALIMIRQIMDAYAKGDVNAALEIRAKDEHLDKMHNAAYREILNMITDKPDQLAAFAHYLMIAKNLERIGDQIANMTEQLFYAQTGALPAEPRVKYDLTSDSI